MKSPCDVDHDDLDTTVKCKIQDLLKLQVKLGENGMDEEKELDEAK